MKFGKLFFMAMSLALAASCPAQPGREGKPSQAWTAGQPLAASHQHLLDWLVALIGEPQRLSERWVKQVFGDTYLAQECTDDLPLCDFVNVSDDRPPVRLHSFRVKNPVSAQDLIAGVFLELQPKPCLKQETVDHYFGKPATQPFAQPAFLILTGKEELPFQMEYKNLDSRGARGYGYIMLTKGCVTQLSLSFYSTPR